MELRRIIIVTLVCLAVATGLLALARAADAASGTTLMVHAGAGIRPPLDELGEMFQRRTGVRVDYNYKGSGCLLADICFSRTGDVYIPGELFYVQQARDRGFIRDQRTVARMSTIIIAQRGNPRNIRSLRDLTRSGLRVGLGDPEAVAAGRAAVETLDNAGLRVAVQRNVVMTALNVIELGNAVKLRHLDAAIVWDATAALFGDQIAAVSIPAAQRVECPVPVATLTFSEHPREAAQFMAFLAGEEGARVFREHGYEVPTNVQEQQEETSS